MASKSTEGSEEAPVRQKRDAEATRNRLIEAARREFSARGLEGARVHAIASTARINKQLVYHYFKNKEELYTLVLEDAYRRFRRENIDEIEKMEPEDAVRYLAELLFDSFKNLRQEIAIIGDENIHKARHVKQSSAIKEMHRPLARLMGSITTRGQLKGTIRKGIDPIHLFIYLLSISSVFFSNSHTLSAIFDRDLSDPDEIAAWRAFVGDVAYSAISSSAESDIGADRSL